MPTLVVIGFLRLFQLFVFASQPFAQDRFLGPELFKFFIFRHAATLADSALILQLHSPTEWLPATIVTANSNTSTNGSSNGGDGGEE